MEEDLPRDLTSIQSPGQWPAALGQQDACVHAAVTQLRGKPDELAFGAAGLCGADDEYDPDRSTRFLHCANAFASMTSRCHISNMMRAYRRLE
jgi:hypothetical protein